VKVWSRESIASALLRYYQTYGDGPTVAALSSLDWLPTQATVRKYYGSITEACEDLGIPPRPRGAAGHLIPTPRCTTGRFAPRNHPRRFRDEVVVC
jgi:hypothetical protein